MNPAYLPWVANHLWQSSLFAGVAGLLTLALRKNPARVRHWVWLAASLKFLIPLSVLIALGSHIGWRMALETTAPNASFVMNKVSQPFSAPAVSLPLSAVEPAAGRLPALLLGTWACGFAGIGFSWWRGWRRIRAGVSAGSLLHLEMPIRAMSSSAVCEPGVFGIFRPVLLLPEGITARLMPAQLRAVIAHELCHVRHRDNLIAAIHMFVETVFWFHPLVWWIGKRMVEERESACDEEVLRHGCEPRVYAEGILKICKMYVESPLACVSGVTGSNLKKRIEAIMANRVVVKLTFAKKAALASAGAIVVAAPIAVGILNAPFVEAQSKAEAPAFEVASIKPAVIPAGREGGNRSRIERTPKSLAMWNVDLNECVQWAYGVASYQVSAPHQSSESYDILAKSAASVPVSQLRTMLGDLLAKRFKLSLHRETRMLPVYELVIAKGGPKLPAANAGSSLVHAAESLPRIQNDSFLFADASMAEFAQMLAQLRGVELPVVDRTGIQGNFDIVLKSGPSLTREGDVAGLFAIIPAQLGLRLVSAKAPIEVVVIDHAEKPSEN